MDLILTVWENIPRLAMHVQKVDLAFKYTSRHHSLSRPNRLIPKFLALFSALVFLIFVLRGNQTLQHQTNNLRRRETVVRFTVDHVVERDFGKIDHRFRHFAVAFTTPDTEEGNIVSLEARIEEELASFRAVEEKRETVFHTK